MCEPAAREPAFVLPALTTTIGLRRPTPCNPGEAAGIAERLQVKQDDVGIVIVLPVFQEIVAGDIRSIADAYACGHAQAKTGGDRQNRQAKSPAVGRNGNVAERGTREQKLH